MLIVISPAKTLNFEPQTLTNDFSQPQFLRDSRALIKCLREFSPDGLSKLMKISEKLAVENHERNQKWKTPFNAENAKQAVLAFRGDVYLGLNADEFGARDFKFAQGHLRILSGLYGLLRPLDLIQAYRLEMGTRLENDRGNNLYEFWGEKITKALNADLKESKANTLVNLASDEYYKSINEAKVKARVVTPGFKELRNGKYQFVSFNAKKARGLLSAYIIQNRLKKADDIKNFDVDGYEFNEELSTDDKWMFTRVHTAAPA
ncbi:MAG: peroxide stress protein YaaA [Planctomycetaceae bacterium]|nr:peroxide stress protein YaaA [Planctomycetaceae bacterium]